MIEKKYIITKCICNDITFEKINKKINEKKIKRIEDLRKVMTVASNCKLCLPYINKMIETGQTSFENILEL
jgi:bacterioferritin-associated ferredoxin